MPSKRLDDRELEQTLREVGRSYAFPAERDLAPAVRARLSQPERLWWAALGPPRFALAPALATLLVLAIGTLAFQPVASQAVEALGLRGIAIFRVPSAPAPTAGAPRLPDATRAASVADASRTAGFAVLVPRELGEPDEVYVRSADGQTQVSLVFLEAPGIPVSPYAGVSVLVTQVRGALELSLLGKGVPPESRVEEVRVDGARAVWIEGQPHQVFYRDPQGNVVVDTLRLAGNVLLLERGELLLRIEAQTDLTTATRIAASLR